VRIVQVAAVELVADRGNHGMPLMMRRAGRRQQPGAELGAVIIRVVVVGGVVKVFAQRYRDPRGQKPSFSCTGPIGEAEQHGVAVGRQGKRRQLAPQTRRAAKIESLVVDADRAVPSTALNTVASEAR